MISKQMSCRRGGKCRPALLVATQWSHSNAEVCDRELIQEVELIERQILPVGNRGVEADRRSPVEIVQAILRRVSNTPHHTIFVEFLRRLQRIDSSGVHTDSIWTVLARLVRRSALRQKTVDSQASPPPAPPRPRPSSARARVPGGPPRAPGVMPSATTHENTVIQDSSHKVDSCPFSYTNPTSSSMLRESSSTSTLPPAPPPMPPSLGLPPPPPPLLGGLRNPLRPDSAPPSSRLTPRGGPDEPPSTAGQLPQQRTPLPKTQMKRLQWNKIPVNRVASSPGNLWTEVAGMFNGYQLNFERMEELFANAGNGGGGGAQVCSGGNGSAGWKSGRELPVPDGSSCERKTKKMDEINLIDSKRSMNVNIFLRQFRTSNIDIVKCLRSGNSRLMGPERLRSLIKVLPEQEDVQLLSTFAGDRTQLGSAEKFYLELIALPNHRFLAESLLMKEEFPQTIDYVKPAIDAIILSARDIKDSKALHEILYTVLMAGNFLNSGVYSGNAAGFQLQSLLRLSELRANKPRMNLLHFVAQEIETNNPHLIDKLKKLKYLAEASHYSIEALLNDISTLQNRVRTISSQISIAEQHFQRQMKDFLEMALGEMEVLELDMRELEELRLEFAAYLCEDPQTFKLDECLSTFNTFCKMFHKALEENKERHIQDLRAEERRQLREEQIASKRRSVASDESQSRRSPDGSAMSSPDIDTIDCARQRNLIDQRRMQISQKMPAFLIESSMQDSSRESSPCPAVTTTAPNNNRHKKRNSMSNFFRNDSRKMIPQTPGGEESTNANDSNNELIDVLLKSAASVAEDSDRRPGSASVRQRRRSRASIDILDRERAPSPAPLNSSVPHMETGSGADGGAASVNGGRDQLDRGQPGRSSCPSRISSAQGRKQQLLKDALLNQHAASDANGTDGGQTEESGGSGPSDAEVSAKQERENRRMERRRRSRVNSSISSCDSKSLISSEQSTTEPPASGVTNLLSQSTGSELNNSTTRIPAHAQDVIHQLNLRGKSATDTRPTAVETNTETASNLVAITSSSSAADQFYEDVVKSKSMTATAIRRDAAKIRSSLGDQRRWSSELERLGTTTGTQVGSLPSSNSETGSDAGRLSTAGTIAKGASEHSIIHQTTTHGKTIRRASAEHEAAVTTAPPRKARLDSLVKQHSIPEQRISSGSKLSSGSHKNIANAKGNQRNENESKNLGSQSDDRNSDENLRESTSQLFDENSAEKMSEGQGLNVTVETERDGVATTKFDHSHHSETPTLNSQEGCSSQGPNADGDRQKRWGKVFENEDTEDPNSTSRETRQHQSPDDETDQEDKEEEEERDGTKESTLQSATARDYGDLSSSSTAVERASTRKEKLRKLSQLYSVEDDVDVPRTGHAGTENVEEAVPRVRDKPATRTQSRESAEQRSETDSFYSARDDGFESEGHSLCSASQRNSMSSTAESDIRVTPLMTRKTYPAGGEKEEVGTDTETSSGLLLGRTSIDSVVSASRMEKATAVSPRPGEPTRRTSSAVNRSLTKTTTPRSTISGSRELHTADKPGVRKGLSKAIERPKGQATYSAAASAATTASRMLPRSVPSPRNVAASNAVQFRIAKPNMVAVSRTPTPRAAKTSPDKPTLTSSTFPATKQNPTPAAAAMGKSPTKTETKPKSAAVPIRRHENRVTPAATITGEKLRTQERPVQSPAFVRGVGVRATVPADVLRENKKAASESRQVRNITTPMTTPRRTTSTHDADNTSSTAATGDQKTGATVLHPRKPSVSAAGLPAVDLSEARLDTSSANEGKSSTRKASSELRMPLSSRSDRSKAAASRIPDSTPRRISADPSIGDGKVHQGITSATVTAGMSRQNTTTPVVSVQAKVIHVASTRSKAYSAINERRKSRMPTSKTVSVNSLA